MIVQADYRGRRRREDTRFRLWPETHSRESVMSHHTIRTAIALLIVLSIPSHAATLLVANKSEASVTLHDVPSGEVMARLPTGTGPHEVAVSPDGRTAVISNYGAADKPGESLTVIDVPGATVLSTIALPAGSRPHGVAWIDGHSVAVTAEGIAALLVVDVRGGRVLEQIAVDQAVAHMVALSSDGNRAFTANIGAGTATAIDIDEARKLADLPSGEGAEGIALVRQGRELWVSNRGADTISVFSTRTLEKLTDIPTEGFPIRLEADPVRGRVFVTLPARDRLAVVDPGNRSIVREIAFDIEPDTSRKTIFGDRLPNSSVPIGVLLSRDGEYLFVAHSAAHLVSVWDTDSLEMIGTIATGLEPDGMDYSALSVTK